MKLLSSVLFFMLSFHLADAVYVRGDEQPRLSHPLKELSLRASTQPGTSELTTEQVWTLDPGELNPHRARWVVRREVRLVGLEAVRVSPGHYGIQASSIESHAENWVRGAGPWYLDPSFAPCHDDPERRFATAEGTRRAVDTAAALWQKVLQTQVPVLANRLGQIRSEQPYFALNRAVQIYSEWLRSTEAEWRTRGYPAARAAEWEFYREQGMLQSCRQSKKLPLWRAMMEPVPAQAPVPVLHADAPLEDEAFNPDSPGPKPRLRAPARRWDGAFSVRGDLVLTNVSLTGQWLIDSGAPMSLIAPDWETGQGVPSELLQVPGDPLEHFSYTAAGGAEGLAPRIQADGLKVSRERFEIADFLLHDLELFDQPQNAGGCCDGILGADFLAHQVVELSPAQPSKPGSKLGARAQVFRVWPKDGFSPPQAILPDAEWIEAYYSNERVPTSSCDGVSVRWESGSSAAWRGSVLPKGGALSCQGIPIARGILHGAKAGPRSNVPGVGMPILGRGPVIFDLPHGRIWFSKAALAKPIPHNRSGLHLRYLEAKDARLLQVTAIEPRSAAAKLAHERGLKPGAILTRLGGKDTEEMDLWEVEEFLSGAMGEEVALEWKVSGKSRKMLQGTLVLAK